MKTNRTNKSLQQQRPSSEEIAARAYEIYEREGRPEGRDFDHWLAAETQLIAERAKPARSATVSQRTSQAATTPLAPALSRTPRAEPRPSALAH